MKKIQLDSIYKVSIQPYKCIFVQANICLSCIESDHEVACEENNNDSEEDSGIFTAMVYWYPSVEL